MPALTWHLSACLCLLGAPGEGEEEEDIGGDERGEEGGVPQHEVLQVLSQEERHGPGYVLCPGEQVVVSWHS